MEWQKKRRRKEKTGRKRVGEKRVKMTTPQT
jgi:hypothetical protein